MAGSLQHVTARVGGGMLDVGGDDAHTATVQGDGAADSDIGRLGGASGEDNLLWPRTDQTSNLGPRLLDRRMRPPAQGIDRGRVAELFPQVGQHGLQHLRIDGRRCVVVEIDWVHDRTQIGRAPALG